MICLRTRCQILHENTRPPIRSIEFGTHIRGTCASVRAVAQLGSALVWGTRGRRFKSCQPDTVKTLVDDHKSSARVLCFSGRTPYGHLTFGSSPPARRRTFARDALKRAARRHCPGNAKTPRPGRCERRERGVRAVVDAGRLGCRHRQRLPASLFAGVVVAVETVTASTRSGRIAWQTVQSTPASPAAPSSFKRALTVQTKTPSPPAVRTPLTTVKNASFD